MQILQATNEESKTNEFYFISDNLDLDVLKECLSYGLKHYDNWRDWHRVSRVDLVQLLNQDAEDKIKSYQYQDSNTLKYIVLENEDNVQSLLVFPKTINHDDFYHSFIITDETYYKVVSAGFTNLRVFEGRSETLNKNSRIEDKELFNG